MKVIGYVRVSTEEQARDGVSLATQESKVRTYCALHDLELAELLVEPGASAKTLDRPAIRAALEVLDAGAAQGLVVAKLDRLTRNLADWAYLIDAYFGDKSGRSLMSVADSIDTRTAAGRMILNLLVTIAQWEREVISERTLEAMAYLKAQGVPLGGANPKCRNLDAAARAKGSAAAAAARVARSREDYGGHVPTLLDLRSRGLTYRAIAAWMNESGAPSPTGRPWGHGHVRRLIESASVGATA